MRTLISLLLAVMLLGTVCAHAEKDSSLGITQKTYEAITEIQALLEAEQWQAAREALLALLEKKLNGYERAHALNMLGYTYFNDENYDQALASFQEALTQPGLPITQVRALLTTTSQVCLAAERYEDAEKYALELLAQEEAHPQPQSQIILAQAYIGMEEWQKAVSPLKKAIKMQVDAGAKPRENWMLMLSSVYYSLEDYESMRDILYQMVELYPAERYLINLAALHGQLGDTDKQLALIESLLDEQRLEKSYHLMSLVNLFLAKGMPFKAADLLQREMASGRIETTQQHLEMESQAWYLAGEEDRAIPPLERAAALSDDGELYLRVARLYMDSYQWQPAEKAARKALQVGGLRDEGGAWLVVGMALARGDELEAARKAFLQAAEHEKSEQWAQQWLGFVDSEQRRIAALTAN